VGKPCLCTAPDPQKKCRNMELSPPHSRHLRTGKINRHRSSVPSSSLCDHAFRLYTLLSAEKRSSSILRFAGSLKKQQPCLRQKFGVKTVHKRAPLGELVVQQRGCRAC